MNYKLGSLFDGSGGFPLSGALCDVEPCWASEVEPYPIAVTRTRFPTMKHLGDISKINGAEIEPVDIITFGSPCQDLSVAGKRAGLKHEANGDEETTRSGLFMEAVRIIKEMRRATNGKYPRFALWENVPGAFSSNKGEDFRIVCEELIKIVEPRAYMPEVPKNGWPYADSYIGDGWSLAYRTFDAQYWGVPQRRRRIHLIADFRGERAREVLFEREGVRGYFTQGRTPWQTTPAHAEGSTGADDREGEGFDGYNGDLTGDKSATLGVNCVVSTGRNGVIERCGGLDAVEPPIIYTRGYGGNIALDGVTPTLEARAGTGGNNQPIVAYSFDSLASNSMKSKNPHSGCREVDVAKTLDTTDPNPSKNQGEIAIVEPIGFDAYNQAVTGDVAKSLTSRATDTDHIPAVIAIDRETYNCGFNFERDPGLSTDGISSTVIARGPSAVCYSVENHPADSRVNLDESGKVQTLTSRMGTGGGNVPMVMEPFVKSARARSADDATTWKHGKVANTLNTFDLGETRANELVVEEQPVYCLQGNGIDRADTASCNGKGWKEDTSYTLNTIDRPAVVYAVDQQGGKGGANYAENVMPTLCSDSHGTPHGVVYAVDQGGGKSSANVTENKSPTLCTTHGGEPAVAYPNEALTLHGNNYASTLMARDYKGVGRWDTLGSVVSIPDSSRYIVRRLTPTECARLQGFADRWGDIEKKDSLSPEEYEFWLEVRNTHAAINGKKVQDYTEKQMVTWYNKLHTDSAEYKMWGNGIALPPALYCLQGIVDALNSEEEDELNRQNSEAVRKVMDFITEDEDEDDDWLL